MQGSQTSITLKESQGNNKPWSLSPTCRYLPSVPGLGDTAVQLLVHCENVPNKLFGVMISQGPFCPPELISHTQKYAYHIQLKMFSSCMIPLEDIFEVLFLMQGYLQRLWHREWHLAHLSAVVSSPSAGEHSGPHPHSLQEELGSTSRALYTYEQGNEVYRYISAYHH